MSKILILDEDEAIRLLYKLELEDVGYTVIDTIDYQNLLEVIGRIMPDLIIMDTRLGRLNGYTILQQIKRRYDDIPIILCTAFATFQDDLRCNAADYYVAKSIDLNGLKIMIHLALGQKRHGKRETFMAVQENHSHFTA